MPYIIGVDGGNSKTYTVITDENGKKLGTGIAGCGNHQVNLDLAMKHIKQSIDQALAQAGVGVEDIDFVQYGLAGADRDTDFRILREALGKFPFKKWDVVCDTMEGLRTGSPENVGVVLVCGSGTNAAGRNREGIMVQTGGFGYIYGDGAGVGGHSLAVEAFRAAIRSWELREEPTVLTDSVPRALGFKTVEAMFNYYLDENIHRIPAQLSVVLHQAAEEGDSVAIRILENCGKELGMACISVIRRLGGFEWAPIPVVLVGSVIQKGRSPHLLQALNETIKNQGYQAEFVIPTMAPVYGSVLLGMDHLEIERPESLMTKFCNYGGYQDEEA
jgi:N-acetylglucosamine kinase-like BadF-type ATPase